MHSLSRGAIGEVVEGDLADSAVALRAAFSEAAASVWLEL